MKPPDPNGGTVARAVRQRLLRIQFDDELLVDRRRQIGTHRQRLHASCERLSVDLEPVGNSTALRRLQRLGDASHLPTLLADADHVARLHQVGRDIHLASVDRAVAVAHELSTFRARIGEAHAIYEVIEPALEQDEQRFAGHPLAPFRDVEVATKLPLEHPIDAAELLLLAQLDRVFRELGSRLTVLTGRIVSPLDGALVRVAALALEEQFDTFPAAETTDRIDVSGHKPSTRIASHSPALGRPTAIVWNRRDVADEM